MRFPKTIRFRKAEAKIYGKSMAYPRYRVGGYVAGKRRMSSFATYSEAKAAAEELVRGIATGSQTAALNSRQAGDALAALERLDGLYQDTGHRVSLLVGISEYCAAAAKLNGRTLGEAVDGYLSTVASVKRIDLGQAVEQFILERKPKTQAKPGKRPQISAGYAYNVKMWLMEFARTFPGYAVCDITKELLDVYMGKHTAVSPKTRNERRNVVRMLLKWCVRKDFLVETHRLLESTAMAREIAEPEEIELYTAAELADLLHTASEQADFRPLLPIMALCALGGVRLQEVTRLTWEDVFHIDGHVEISSAKSKTRSRRLVSVCPALAGWLAPYKGSSGPIWRQCIDKFHSDFGALRRSLNIPARRNGLRHGFCSFHFALHQNENLTAAEAGNSPTVIHANYKKLATKTEAEKWFAVSPEQPSNVVQITAHTS